MNACIGVGRLDEAAALLDAGVRAGVRLDARAYNVLLKGHARAGAPGALAGLVARMRDAQARAPCSGRGPAARGCCAGCTSSTAWGFRVG